MNDVIIVGASVRAAAESATRAGFRVHAVDYFGDDDTRKIAHRMHIINDFAELISSKDIPDDIPWMSAGGLENSPEVIAAFSKRHPCWGNSADVVRAVRNPWRVAGDLEAHGIPALPLCSHDNPPPRDGSWMIKPLRSAGGFGLSRWDAGTSTTPTSSHYFQKRVEGGISSCLVLSNAESTVVLGMCHLLTASFADSEFLYAGAIGPVAIPSALKDALSQIATIFANTFSLRGLWGFDFGLVGELPMVLEINPRYTATVELYETAWNQSLIPFHAAAFDDRFNEFSPSRISSISSRTNSGLFGKRVLYADRTLVIPEWDDWASDTIAPDRSKPVLADRPAVGSVVFAGEPICTLFAHGANEAGVREQLAHQTEALREHLGLTRQP